MKLAESNIRTTLGKLPVKKLVFSVKIQIWDHFWSNSISYINSDIGKNVMIMFDNFITRNLKFDLKFLQILAHN